MSDETLLPSSLADLILDSLPAAVYATDAEGKITYFNRAATQLAGRVPRAGDAWCVTWRLYQPDGQPLPHDQCPMAIALKEGRPIRGQEAIAERPDGTRFPFVPYPTPVFGQDGSLLGAVNLLVDVSELKQSKANLERRAREQAAVYALSGRLQSAQSIGDICEAGVEAILDALRCERAAVLLSDGNGVMRFTAWRGLSDDYRRAVDGHSPWAADEPHPEPICMPDSAKSGLPSDLLAIVANEGIGALSFIPLIADGRLIGKFMTYYDAPHAFLAEEIDLAMAVARQISAAVARHRAQVQLSDREARLRAVFESAAVGVAVLTPEAHFLEVNPTFSAITGYTLQELQRLDCASLTHPDDCARMRHALDTLIAGQTASFVIEKRYHRKDGRLIWVQNSVSLTRDQQGRPKQLIALCQDISERKSAEEMQKTLIDELNHRVKNMLATIQSVAQQTLRRTPNPAAFADAFQGRVQAIARAHAMLSSRTWSGAELHAILRDQVTPGASDEHRVSVSGPSVLLPPQLALHMAMVAHELATNSRKHGALSIAAGMLDISWTTHGDTLELTWRERGGPPVRAGTKQGFGTTMIERTISGHNGTAEMSYCKDGASWRITLPLPQMPGSRQRRSPIAGERSASPDIADLRMLAGKRILIVEDEPIVAMDLQGVLEDGGCEVVGPATTVEDAVRIISRAHADAALLDANLHGQRVDRVAAALQQREIPFAFVTGYTRDALPASYQTIPVLAKPCTASDVYTTLQTLLARDPTAHSGLRLVRNTSP